MALDTAAKRFSMISFGDFEYANRVPDATDMDEVSDRINEEFLYFGFVTLGGASLFGDRRRRAMASLLRSGWR
jgi:hypothetical protein